MMGTSMENGREGRRRRIAERGAERLALITGRRIQNLPPSTSTSIVLAVSHSVKDEASSEFSHRGPAVELEKIDTNDGEGGSEHAHYDSSAVSNNVEMSSDISRASDKEQDVQLESSHDPVIVQEEYRVEPRVRRGKLFTPKQINSAIAATESTRMYCSLVVAILVSLSYIGFPLLAKPIIKSIVYYRPLYLVLITGISIVLKRLLDGQGVQRRSRELSEVPLVGGLGSVEQLGKALEFGLCFKNITNAVFMDVSVYAIVLVCGLAFAQKLG